MLVPGTQRGAARLGARTVEPRKRRRDEERLDAPAAVGGGGGVPELVEALLRRGADEAPRRAHQAGGRHAARAVALAVAGQRLHLVDLDEVADDPEARGARGLDVAAPLGGRRVRVVDHEALPRVETELDERRLARARAQQVHRHAHMRLQEAVAIERALPAALNPTEDDRLHGPDGTEHPAHQPGRLLPAAGLADRPRAAALPDAATGARA